MAIRNSVAALCLVLSATPAMAQIDPLDELDALSRATADTGAGLALARQQVARGDLTGAVATTERIIALHPESDDALLFHVSLLCRLDDSEGARAEIAELPAGRGGGDWGPVVAACGPGIRGRG
jgi:thioredoxin-like negative regulator of GroEL